MECGCYSMECEHRSFPTKLFIYYALLLLNVVRQS